MIMNNKTNIFLDVGNGKTLGISISYSLEQKILKEYIKERMYQIPPEYIAKELNKNVNSIRSKYEKLCTPNEYVTLKKKIQFMREVIKLIKEKNLAITKSFASPGEFYSHPENPSIKVEKIPLLEVVISDLPPEEQTPFLKILKQIKNPLLQKPQEETELVPYSISFDPEIKDFRYLDEQLKSKIAREISLGDFIDEKTKWAGRSYLLYLTPNQMANVVYTVNKSVMHQITKEYLENLSNNVSKSDDYKILIQAQNKHLEFEKNLKLGLLSQPTKDAIPLLNFDLGANSISLPEIVYLSAYSDLTEEGKSIEEISKLLKISLEKTFLIQNNFKDRWNKKRKHLEDHKIDKYTQKRDSTCYKIAKLIKEDDWITPIKIAEKLKEKYGNLGLLGKVPDSSITSYVNKIKHDGGYDSYIKWFEDHYAPGDK